jgi:recombination protein RecA
MQRRARPRTSRQSGLAKAVAGIERKFGVGALQRLGDLPKTSVDALPTGIDALDRVVGIGGWPRGRICEVFGAEGVGVTTLLLHSLAAAQQRGGIVAFVDVDHAFTPEYARRLGSVVEEIFIGQPDDGPMALVRSGAFDVVALDSVPALHWALGDDRSSNAHEESLNRACLLSEAMRRLAANIDRTRTVVLFGNRLAEKTSYDETYTPGGRALRFYSTVRLAMQRTEVISDKVQGV